MEIRAGESLWVRPSGDKGRGYVLWGNKGCHVHVLTVRGRGSHPKACLHEHQVPNLDHNPHGRGGLSLDLNPVCLRVNTTNLDEDLDQNPV